MFRSYDPENWNYIFTFNCTILCNWFSLETFLSLTFVVVKSPDYLWKIRYVLALVEGKVSRDRILTWVSSFAKPDPFFLVEPEFGPKIRVGPRSKNGSNRVGLASNRVQICVQPYNGGFHLYLFPFDFPFNYIAN